MFRWDKYEVGDLDSDGCHTRNSNNPARPWIDDPTRPSYTNHFCVSHLILSKSGFEYSYSLKLDEHTVTGVQPRVKEEWVTTLIDMSKTFEDAVDYKQSKEELEQRQSELTEKYVNEFIVNGVTDTISVVNPFVGYLIKGGVAVASENMGKAVSSELKAGANAIEKLSDTNIPWKEGAMVGGAAAESLLGYLSEVQQLNQEIENLNQEHSESWFGSSTCYTTNNTTYHETGRGIYDVHTMLAVTDWSNRGIEALLPDASLEEINTLKRSIVYFVSHNGNTIIPDDFTDTELVLDENSENYSKWKCVNAILNGVDEKSESLVYMNIDSFGETIQTIEGGYQQIFNEMLNTKQLFIMKVK